MVHYWRIIQNYGPLHNFWCMRFEGNHAAGLQAARNSANRINLTQTITIDHQLRLAYKLSNDEILKNIINLGLQATLVICQFDEEFVSIKWIDYNGRLYKAGRCVVRTGTYDDLPYFKLVTAIFAKQETVVLSYQNIRTLGFDEHCNSYVVELNEIDVQNQYINVNNLPDSTPLYLRKINQKHYITPPYAV